MARSFKSARKWRVIYQPSDLKARDQLLKRLSEIGSAHTIKICVDSKLTLPGVRGTCLFASELGRQGGKQPFQSPKTIDGGTYGFSKLNYNMARTMTRKTLGGI